MDPLSLTAGVIAAIQISSKVIKLCYDYQEVARKASRDANRIVSEVSSLQGNLDQLLKLAADEYQKGSSRLPSLDELTKPNGPFTECKTQLEVLLKALEQGAGLKALGKALIRPFKEKEVKRSLESIRAFKASLILALSVDQAQVP